MRNGIAFVVSMPRGLKKASTKPTSTVAMTTIDTSDTAMCKSATAITASKAPIAQATPM